MIPKHVALLVKDVHDKILKHTILLVKDMHNKTLKHTIYGDGCALHNFKTRRFTGKGCA